MNGNDSAGVRVSVALIDDDGLVLAFGNSLDAHEDIAVLAVAATVDALLEALDEPPDVVVLDVVLADGSMFPDNVRRLHEWGTRVVVVTSDTVTPGFRVVAWQENVAAFLIKSSQTAGLVEAVRRAPDGTQQETDEWRRHLVHSTVRLTPTETRVIRMYAAGMTYQELATALAVHPDTTKRHIGNIRAKYRAAGRPAVTRAELVWEARNDGHLPGLG